MLESEIQNAILIKYGREPDLTLWRNNTGQLREEWVTVAHLKRLAGFLATGELAECRKLVHSLITMPARYVRYGLCVGSSDLIGVVTLTRHRGVPSTLHCPCGLDADCAKKICQCADDDCACPIADYRTDIACGIAPEPLGVMFAAEIKRPCKHPTKEQQQFIDLINARGGVAGCVHSLEEFGALLEQARNR